VVAERYIARVEKQSLRDEGFCLVAELFGDDFITAAQWGATHGQRLRNTPSHRLLWGVLEQALRDCLTPKHKASARAWIADDGIAPYGFVPLCEYLGIDPDWLRSGLDLWMRRVAGGWRPGGAFGHGIVLRGPADCGMLDRARTRGPYRPRRKAG